MNRDQRKRNIEFINSVRAGKKEPWDGLTVLWFLNDDGDFTFGPHIIAPNKLYEFIKLVGGKHLIFRPAEGCLPIGESPEDHLSQPRTLVERAKDIVNNAIEKIFHSEEPDKPIEVPQPEPERFCDMAYAGFQPSAELLEAREIVNELNYRLNGFNTQSYGIQINGIGH